jgi:SAM-dependent methyltransferase
MKNLHQTQVSQQRWAEAQQWERSHWIKQQKNLARYGKNVIWRLLARLGIKPRYRGDDRNYWWSKYFDHYTFLPPSVENAIEVGCGPYTNMRLIWAVCKSEYLVLSDPLISTYINFKMTFLKEMHQKGACVVDNHPLERLPFADDFFDLVVMINVLDHVQNADQCLRSIERVARPGGFVVIGQDLSNAQDLAAQPDGLRTGHPITLDEDWFSEKLFDRYEVILRKVIPRAEGWAPDWHYGTLAFVGKKR